MSEEVLPTTAADLDRWRAQTPGCENLAHFNNCGASLMPQPVVEAVIEHLQLENQLGGYEAEEAAQPRLQACYQALARMLGCQSSEIALIENATRAWDMIFYAFEFQPGDRILTSRSEYVSNYLAFLQMAQRRGVVIEPVPDDAAGSLDLAALEALLQKPTALVAITHVPTGSGLVNPAAGVGALCRAAGVPLLLDACQSAGQMPLDVNDLQADFLTATSRKFLRGPRGVGFLYIREPWIERLHPPFVDLLAADWVADDRYQLRPDARRFETWEGFVAGRVGFGVAVEYALEVGLERIQKRASGLAAQLRSEIAQLPGFSVHDRGHRQCAIVSFTHARHDVETIKRALREQRINVSTSTRMSTRLAFTDQGLHEVVRAAPHYYNSEAELERLIGTLAALA